ncbi:TPA: F-type conjugal transfer pilus assembly protein TraB [Enterobacter hormaechei subsp. xiangfangensis]|uniref:F-type conjugal transfer pilus assembly protein TraB n=1 Tax=Enterobacter cloacae complex TaxID=354276 RepID=UPI001330B9EB|nr:F-type conjugal transfer pilus assembly protein TraB [Enterobacter roggenkampii]MCM7653689.1 F-type conjugal transfer pilus assembly protein TraB [Enterobacter hormaechei]HCM9429402.1 F-type conjugal transfer pilus assembly protein TraB [Enterobacter hormaechei subsp. xiangfangensis]
MSFNINKVTQRKQLAVLIGGLLVAGLATGAIVYIGNQSKSGASAPATPVPNMTGVVTPAFETQLNDSALAQQQAKTSALESQMLILQQQFTQNKQSFDEKLQKKDQQIEALTQQLQSRPAAASSPTAAAPGGDTPLPGPVSAGQTRPPQYSVTPNGGQGTAAVYNPQQGAAFYPGGSGRTALGGLDTKSFTYASMEKKPTKLPWISSGSFSDAVMIEGADANASVTGQQNTTPVTFRLLGKVQMPNNHEYDLDGCFVSGEIWGDISSERGIARTSAIACKLKNGKNIDMPFKGHLSYQGKGGIRGKPVMRNGKIIGYAGAAGFLSGIGAGIQSAATPAVGLGATASVSGMDIMKQGFGGGAEKAADNLSQYWIKLAEQYHPVIDIGAGNAVTVVFQEGFRLETLEDSEAEKAKEAAQEAGAKVQTVAASSPLPQATSTTAVGNLNPDDVLRQASQLRLGDTIN